MSARLNVSAVLVFIAILFLYGCSSGQYFGNFKSVKKNVDSLTIFRPHAFVKYRINQTQNINHELASQLSNQISEITHSILQEKYVLLNPRVDRDSIAQTDLIHFFSNLDESKSQSEITFPGFLKEVSSKSQSRYAVMLFFEGYYNGNFSLYHDYQRAAQTNSIYITIGDLSRTDLRLLIIDTSTEKIVYYNKEASSKNDPRSKKAIDLITRKILKSIYYM